MEHPSSSGGMTLLAQLSTMPSMSSMIDSPVPSVGSVVPNMQQRTLSASFFMANGLAQQPTPEVCLMGGTLKKLPAIRCCCF